MNIETLEVAGITFIDLRSLSESKSRLLEKRRFNYLLNKDIVIQVPSPLPLRRSQQVVKQVKTQTPTCRLAGVYMMMNSKQGTEFLINDPADGCSE